MSNDLKINSDDMMEHYNSVDQPQAPSDDSGEIGRIPFGNGFPPLVDNTLASFSHCPKVQSPWKVLYRDMTFTSGTNKMANLSSLEGEGPSNSNKPLMSFDDNVPQLGPVLPFNSESEKVPTSNTNDYDYYQQFIETIVNEKKQKKKEADQKHRAKKKESIQKLKEDLSKSQEEVNLSRIEISNRNKAIESANVKVKELLNEVCTLKGQVKELEAYANDISHQFRDNNHEGKDFTESKRKFAAMSEEDKWENYKAAMVKDATLKKKIKTLTLQNNAMCFQLSKLTEVDSEED